MATGSTGRLIEEKAGVKVECVAHGPDGGDLIIGGRVATGHIRAVIFFRDPLTAQIVPYHNFGRTVFVTSAQSNTLNGVLVFAGLLFVAGAVMFERNRTR